jgi:hypothetical protein
VSGLTIVAVQTDKGDPEVIFVIYGQYSASQMVKCIGLESNGQYRMINRVKSTLIQT